MAAAVSHLRQYLPPGTRVRGTIALAAFLPNYAFSMDEAIVVSLTDSFWANDSARVFNLLAHELFHNGFLQHQHGESPSEAKDRSALLRSFLWQLQNEGLATYVAYRMRPPDLALADYRLLESAEEVSKRFDLCRRLTQDLESVGELAPLKD